MADGVANIKHIVVLMLENRSFDNVLGWLYDPQNAPPFNQVPAGQSFEGLTGVPLTNPYNGQNYPPGHTTDTTQPYPDPNEIYERVYMQMFNPTPFTQPNPIPDPAGTPNMQGFVNDYATAKNVAAAQAPMIMNSFRPADLPVISTLAASFAVCDHWFAPIPTQTIANRSFIHAGSSSGYVDNDWTTPHFGLLINLTTTLQNLLAAAGVAFRFYYANPTRLFTLGCVTQLNNFGYIFGPENQPLTQFYADIQDASTFPQYSFIEPNYIANPITGLENDEHPGGMFAPSDALYGEQLIADVYDALTKSPEWPSTLFVITFDEHGGTFDHVIPPAATPPDNLFVQPGQGGYSGFKFDRCGVRVPAVLVSPWIKAGTVVNTAFDHTSLVKTVLNCFGVSGSLGDRVAAATDLSGALNLTAARTDIPQLTARAIGNGEAVTLPPSDALLTDFQRTLLAHAMRAASLHPAEAAMAIGPVPETQGEARDAIARFAALAP
jgi:phospholipase C